MRRTDDKRWILGRGGQASGSRGKSAVESNGWGVDGRECKGGRSRLLTVAR